MSQLFREPEPSIPSPKEPVASGPTQGVPSRSSDVEVPFTDYQSTHNKPYSVDYFGLSDMWNDPAGSFEHEVETIETYLKSKVDRGDLANSLPAIREELKDLEKTNNLKKEERVTMKIGILSEYVKFLMATDGIKFNIKKYGTR